MTFLMRILTERLMSFALHKLLRYTYKISIDIVKVQIFFTVFSINLKKKQALHTFFLPIINILFTNIKCM